MLCDRADHFNYAGRTEFDDYHVGTIPWFETEEWKHAFGMLGGRLPTTDFFILDCDQIVDPVLASSDSKLLQGAAHFVSNKHQRLYRSEMEAVVFSARLEHVPDLVIVPQRDPNRAYFKRTLRGQPCDLAEHYNLPRSLRNKYWIGSASPESGVAVLNDELQSLLSARDWCIVQVIGGYCVVMTAHWHGNRPAKAPKTETEIANNIEFAVQVFDHFWRQSPAATEAAEATNYNPNYHEPDHQDRRAGVATLSAPVRAAAPAAASSVARGSISQPTTAIPPLKAAARRRHSMLMLTALFGLGIPSSLLGSLCMIGTAVDLQRGEAAQAWPQVKGTITRAEIDTRVSGRNGRKREKYRPGIAYAYEVDKRSYSNDKIMFGVTMRTESRQEIEQVMSAYPLGAGVDVCYDPNDPSSSVLQPGVENRSMILAIRNVSAGILVLGIALCGYGFMGRKRRP